MKAKRRRRRMRRRNKNMKTLRREERREGRKEREREKGWGRKTRGEIYSEETGFYEASTSDILGAGERPGKNRLLSDLYPNRSSLFIKWKTTVFKELIFQ